MLDYEFSCAINHQLKDNARFTPPITSCCSGKLACSPSPRKNDGLTRKSGGIRASSQTSVFTADGKERRTRNDYWLSFSQLRFFFFFQSDLEPPKFASCPDDIHKTSAKKMHKVYLPGVTVTDNVGVQFFKTSRKNGSEFTWGEHNITYTAEDKAGNTAKCHFRVIIGGMNNLLCQSDVIVVSRE